MSSLVSSRPGGCCGGGACGSGGGGCGGCGRSGGKNGGGCPCQRAGGGGCGGQAPPSDSSRTCASPVSSGVCGLGVACCRNRRSPAAVEKPQDGPWEHPGESLLKRLDELVKDSPVMLFIKGTYDHPRCKWSRRLMHLIFDHGVGRFGYVDILGDQDVREGLKVYGDNPQKTFPQVWIHGKLLGGYEAFKSLVEDRKRFLETIPLECFVQIAPRQRIRLHSTHPGVTLFMRGTAEAPATEEGKAAVELLQSRNVEFNLVDLDSRPDLIEGLKQYSKSEDLVQFWMNSVRQDPKDLSWLDAYVMEQLQKQGKTADASAPKK